MKAASASNALDQDAAAYLRQRVEALPGGGPVQRVEAVADEVWRIHLQDGRCVIAKHHIYGALTRGTPYDLLQVEKKLLQILSGRRVPRWLGGDEEGQLAFYVDCGAATLDDVWQGGDTALIASLTEEVCAELVAIEANLKEHEPDLVACVMPAATPEALKRQWEAAGEAARTGLGYMLGREDPAALQALDEVLGWLGGRRPYLGAIDYNARNIAVDAVGRIAFLEWAKLGWDWTERRCLQYTTSMGAGRADGTWVCPLDAAATAHYARWRGGDAAAALDGHHLVFHLNAVAMLGTALEEGDAALLQRWARPRKRLGQLRRGLGLKLSGDRRSERVRVFLRTD